MNPLNDIAEAYLAIALAVTGVAAGRTGEGGPISQTPFVEVGDNTLQFTRLYQGQQTLRWISTHVVIFFIPYQQAAVAENKTTLRRIAYDFLDSHRSQETLGGAVYDSYPVTGRVGVTTRNGTP